MCFLWSTCSWSPWGHVTEQRATYSMTQFQLVHFVQAVCAPADFLSVCSARPDQRFLAKTQKRVLFIIVDRYADDRPQDSQRRGQCGDGFLKGILLGSLRTNHTPGCLSVHRRFRCSSSLSTRRCAAFWERAPASFLSRADSSQIQSV